MGKIDLFRLKNGLAHCQLLNGYILTVFDVGASVFEQIRLNGKTTVSLIQEKTIDDNSNPDNGCQETGKQYCAAAHVFGTFG